MTIRMDELIQAVATALDIVESGLLGASGNHGRRIAVLCSAMGKELGMSSEDQAAIAACAMLHDNALTEYILSEGGGGDKRPHCTAGQRNIDSLPFPADVSGVVLYHHEYADGSGPFHKRTGEFPLGAELIAIADTVDVVVHLQRVAPDALPALRESIAQDARFTPRAAGAMLQVLDAELLLSLRDDRIIETSARLIPAWTVELTDTAVMRFAGLIARIIDYQSAFTRMHSVQLANRAWLMADAYGFDPARRAQVYLAASLHDLGKLGTPKDILEKPGKLSREEYLTIMEHVRLTHELLKDISGLEQLCAWASEHHEKLDGSGYPFGRTADELDTVSRLLVCLDIYQAVSEERPYHARRSHDDTMPILLDMAGKGLIDADIVKDIDRVMGGYSGTDVPPPAAL